MPEPRTREITADGRGASEVLGYVFVFTLIVISIGIVTVGGMGSLQDTRDAEQAENAEQGYDVLHDTLSDLYSDGAPSRASEISLGQSEMFYGANVTVNVTVVDDGTPIVTEREIRPLVQRLGNDNRLVYEAGAVFRTTPDSGLTIHDPPHMYRSDSAHVTVPAFQSDSVRGVGSSTVLVRAKVTDRSVPVSIQDADGSDELIVNVTSPRYERWSEYLRAQPSVDTCTTDDANERVECEFDVDSGDRIYVAVHDADIFLLQ